MRTKQPIRSKRDHFMYLDSLESDHIEPVKMLVKQKAVTEVASSPTSIFAPMSAPPTIKLPEAVAKPPLPSASVWGSASPMLKRVWSSSREHEVMEEWLDEVTLQNQAKMVLEGASGWPEKDLEHKTKHSRLHEKFWAKKRTEKKRSLERTALTEHAPRRAKVRRDQRRASRSARCFALDDGENLVWVMSQKQIERRREVAAALAVAAVQYDVKRMMVLLRRESTVQATRSLPPHTPSPMPSLSSVR
jgi:hypothetical protein